MSQDSAQDADDISSDSSASKSTIEVQSDISGFLDEDEPDHYDPDNFISGPIIPSKSTVDKDLLQFEYSYGYECNKLFNLAVLEEKWVAYTSGNILHFYNVEEQRHRFRRSFLGSGIGHIASLRLDILVHLAVGENGKNPPIIVYVWPSMHIYTILKGGALKGYSHLTYSPEGDLLVSQATAPDYTITIWNWRAKGRSKVIMRQQSHISDVYRVMFSDFVEGQIVTSGVAHLKFWRLWRSFTGLKLFSQIGRFGKTDLCSSIGLLPMPNQTVFSSTDWGNMLLWQGSLIKFEINRMPTRRCHKAPIVGFEYSPETREFWSVGMDGVCKCWDYKAVENADPPEGDRVVSMVPVLERYNEDARYMCIMKKTRRDDREDLTHFAQDANGAIWLMDLTFKYAHEPPKKLFVCHSGPITDLAICPWGNFFASIGEDGKIIVYCYETNAYIQVLEFKTEGRCLIWVPMKLDPSGSTLIGGFGDGALRIVVIDLFTDNEISMRTIQTIKPHSKAMTILAITPDLTMLVTGGEDANIFLFNIQYNDLNAIVLEPIGFVPVTGIPTCYTWHPHKDRVIYMGCLRGEFIECEIPSNPEHVSPLSYLLDVKPNVRHFCCCKSMIRRDIVLEIERQKKQKKLDRKRQSLEKVREEHPDLDIPSDLYIYDSDSDPIIEALFIPEVPGRIWFIQYTEHDTLWMSVGGYDAGYIYEYDLDQPDLTIPKHAKMIKDGDDVENHSFAFTQDKKYLFLSQQDGSIRINKLKTDYRDLSDYILLPMHDLKNGRITKMCFSYDEKVFFSCGADGNLFAYLFSEYDKTVYQKYFPTETVLAEAEVLSLDDEYQHLSLEDARLKRAFDIKRRHENEYINGLRSRLAVLRDEMQLILDMNCTLPGATRFRFSYFVIDEKVFNAMDGEMRKITDLAQRQVLHPIEVARRNMLKLKQCFLECIGLHPIVVKGINFKKQITSMPTRHLSQTHGADKKFYRKKMWTDEEESVEPEEKPKVPEGKPKVPERKPKAPVQNRKTPDVTHYVSEVTFERPPSFENYELSDEDLTKTVSSVYVDTRLVSLLHKHWAKQDRLEERREEWDILYLEKPVKKVNRYSEKRSIEKAKKTIGNLVLKCSDNYEEPSRTSAARILLHVLQAREEIHNLKLKFNVMLYRLRDYKQDILHELRVLKWKCRSVQRELPISVRKTIPHIPKSTPNDFPERNMDCVTNFEEEVKYEWLNCKKKKWRRYPARFVYGNYDEVVVSLQIGILGGYNDSYTHTAIRWRNRLLHVQQTFYDQSIEEKFDSDETTKSPKPFWETEMKILRYGSNICKQDVLLREINNKIKSFNNALIAVYKKGARFKREIALLDAYRILLTHEYIITTKFEAEEEKIYNDIRAHIKKILDLQQRLKDNEEIVVLMEDEIRKGTEKIQEITHELYNEIEENNMFGYYRELYKIKYKGKGRKTSRDGSSSCSDTSTESIGGEFDPEDYATILRIDDRWHPKSINMKLYWVTLNYRAQKHAVEEQAEAITDQGMAMNREIETSLQAIDKIENDIRESKDILHKYQHIKVGHLNALIRTVIMRPKQFKYCYMQLQKHKKVKVLLYPRPMVRYLRERQKLMRKDVYMHMVIFRRAKEHYARLKTDIAFMKRRIKQLHLILRAEKMRTFGRIIHPFTVEEGVLNRLIIKHRIEMNKPDKSYRKGVLKYRKLIIKLRKELNVNVKQMRGRAQILRTLANDARKLKPLVERIRRDVPKWDKWQLDMQEYTKDVERLTSVVQVQKKQIETLKAEIKGINTKSSPPAEEEEEQEITEEIVPFEQKGLYHDLMEFDKTFHITDFKAAGLDLDNPPKPITDYGVEQFSVLVQMEALKEILTQPGLTADDIFIHLVTLLLDILPLHYIELEMNINYLSDKLKEFLPKNVMVDEKKIILAVHQNTEYDLELLENFVKELIYKSLTIE